MLYLSLVTTFLHVLMFLASSNWHAISNFLSSFVMLTQTLKFSSQSFVLIGRHTFRGQLCNISESVESVYNPFVNNVPGHRETWRC